MMIFRKEAEKDIMNGMRKNTLALGLHLSLRLKPYLNQLKKIL